LFLQAHRLASSKGPGDVNPVVIGLGEEGARIAEMLSRIPLLGNDVSTYTQPDWQPRGQTEHLRVGTVPEIFRECAAAVLVFSPRDREACAMALSWARRMDEQGVYLKAAVLPFVEHSHWLPSMQDSRTIRLTKELDAVILQPIPWNRRTPLEDPYQPVFQTIRLFFFEPGLVCYDLSDVRHALATGRPAVATTVRSLGLASGGNPARAAELCLQSLPIPRIQRVIAKWQGGRNTTIDDFDAVGQGLSRALGKGVATLVVSGIDPELAEDAGASLLAVAS